MNFIQKHASKATKILVAGVVLGSVSFGAYGFGRAARTNSNPANTPGSNHGVLKVKDTWVPIGFYCDGGCAWEKMTHLVSVYLSTGNYLLTANGTLTNNSSGDYRVDCEIVTGDGASRGISAVSQNNVNAGHSITTTMTEAVTVTADHANVYFNCGTTDDAGTDVQIFEPRIMAQRVATLRVTEAR